MNTREIKNKIASAGFKIDAYARAYIDALDLAEAEGGEHGVKVQILYIFSNLKARGDEQKKVKAELLKYAKSR